MNSVNLVGNVVKDAELRETSNGNAVCNFDLALNKYLKVGEKTTFVPMVIWGERAKSLSDKILKGKKLAVSGELNQNRWEEGGVSNSRLEVIVGHVDFMVHPSAGRND